MIDIEELERLAKAAQANSDNIGEQDWYASEEISALMHGLIAHDDAGLMAGCTPNVILELVAELRRLRAEINDFTTSYGDMNQEVVQLREDLQAAKLLAHANGEMFRAEKVDNESMRCVLDVVRKHLMGWVSFEELHAALVKYEVGQLQANIRPLATG